MNVREKKYAVPKSLEAWGQRYRSTTDDLAYVCLASAGCPISRKYKYRTFRGRGFYHEGDAPE